MRDLEKLLTLLIDNEIRFVVIGGFAAVLHGSTYLTRDLDICLAVSPTEIERLRSCLKDIHPVDTSTTKNIYLHTDLGTLDILTDVAGVGNYEAVLKNAIQITLFNRPLSVISAADLIRCKKTLGRDKDLLVVAELEAALEKK